MTETTRQDIVDAAIVLFNEDMSLPLEKVAEKAGVTRRTLHRYFRDREELIKSCSEEMVLSCKKAMESAMMSSTNPLDQLREMLYASIDCGVKFAFMGKLHTHREHKHTQRKKDCVRYDEAVDKIKSVVVLLKQKNTISKFITTEWAISLFFSVVGTTCNPTHSGGMSHSDLKRFAWYSYSKGIGI
jgi:hypothetical protein